MVFSLSGVLAELGLLAGGSLLIWLIFRFGYGVRLIKEKKPISSMKTTYHWFDALCKKYQIERDMFGGLEYEDDFCRLTCHKVFRHQIGNSAHVICIDVYQKQNNVSIEYEYDEVDGNIAAVEGVFQTYLKEK